MVVATFSSTSNVQARPNQKNAVNFNVAHAFILPCRDQTNPTKHGGKVNQNMPQLGLNVH